MVKVNQAVESPILGGREERARDSYTRTKPPKR